MKELEEIVQQMKHENEVVAQQKMQQMEERVTELEKSNEVLMHAQVAEEYFGTLEKILIERNVVILGEKNEILQKEREIAV